MSTALTKTIEKDWHWTLASDDKKMMPMGRFYALS
jgi:hypothetical protein